MDAFVGPVASSKPPVLQGTNGRLKEREVRAINRTIYQPVRQTARRGVPGGLRTFSLSITPASLVMGAGGRCRFPPSHHDGLDPVTSGNISCGPRLHAGFLMMNSSKRPSGWR